MSLPKVSVLITDLDNTLFDWVDIWHRSFSAMVDKLIELSGVERETLLDEIRVVHQAHGTSEYAFLIEEVPCLGAPTNDAAKSKYDDAIRAFTVERKKSQALYEGVASTLRELKSRGVRIVGYTESMEFYACRRVRELGLDGLIDVLYTSPDHALPTGMTAEQLRAYPKEQYEFKFTEHRQTPKGELKPNPRLLLDIVRDIGAKPEECAYLGDSLFKDVVMAQRAGVLDVFAKYGVAHCRAEYDLLRRVTHWSDKDVEREKKLTEVTVSPTIVVSAFAELLEVVFFTRFVPEKISIDEQIKIWSTIVGTQQHFNDLCLRIRNFAVTVLGTALGVSGLAIKQNMYMTLFGQSLHTSLLLIIASLFAWFAFFFMDRFWYHQLLLGAVAQGMAMESRIAKKIPEISLGHKIKEFSSVNFLGFKLNSSRKFIVFYGAGALAHLVFILAVLWVEPVSTTDVSASSSATIQGMNNALAGKSAPQHGKVPSSIAVPPPVNPSNQHVSDMAASAQETLPNDIAAPSNDEHRNQK